MRVLLRTFGCRANHYDAEQVRALLTRAGADVVDTAAAGSEAPGAGDGSPEVAVLTSCAVTADAEADLRQAVRRLAREHPDMRVIVTGCAAARSGERLAALPNVTAVIPGADLVATAAAVGLPDTAVGHAAPARAARQSTARATLRVQDGCDEHCTFCATTLARGAHRSRAVAPLVEEARALAEHHAEIVLTGVHVGSWGTEEGRSLGSLVRALVDGTRAVRFRLASVEATEIDAELAELLRDGGGRVCPYVHAPLQSGSDAVLRRMGRHWYTASSYASAIERLTRDRAIFGLGADVMTGFPGESDADHAATMAMVRTLPFTHLHVFPYSPRPGTPAARLGGEVPASVARARAAEIRTLAGEKARAYARSRIGGEADLVVISPPASRTPSASLQHPASRIDFAPLPHPASRIDVALRKCLTEDYLEVHAESDAPRGTRFTTRLSEPMLFPPLPALRTE